MKILSIDTSSNLCAVAVLDDTKLIKQNILNDTKNHSEKVMPVIAQTLLESNLKLNDVNLIVCDKGPGSFTGIRIGVATVMSFVDSLKISSIGITSLEALAYNVLLNEKSSDFICSLIDAKNDNVYFELYSTSSNLLTSILPAECKNIRELISLLQPYENICFVGDGAIAHKDILVSNLNNCTFSSYNEISSYSLGIAGLNAYNSGRKDDLLPVYLRKSQAERTRIEISDMKIKDLDLISGSLETDFDNFWNYNIFKGELENGKSKYLVAKIDNKIVGFAGIIPIADEADISNIVVHKDFRNHKIGSHLLEGLINLAKSLNLITLNLEVRNSNIPAIKLYEKYEFEVCGLRRKYYNNTEDAILMKKTLKK